MKQRLIRTESLVLTFAFLMRSSATFASEQSGTVPFIFDDNRVFAEVEFVRPDGTPRKAIAFVDIGTPQLVIEDGLAKELEIERAKQALLHIENLEIVVPASDVQTDTGLGMTGPDGKRTVSWEGL